MNYGFGPAAKNEQYVFGAKGPGHPSKNVQPHEVKEWIEYMKTQRIKRVVCLLEKARELEGYYGSLQPDGLQGIYKEAFRGSNVLYRPIKDFQLFDLTSLKDILEFLRDSILRNERVLVHCSGGSGRTGYILAAWLVYRPGISPGEAIREIQRMGRNP